MKVALLIVGILAVVVVALVVLSAIQDIENDY